MKKLTAGIFSVLIGLCAADSAQAKIASEAWVNQEIGKVSTTVTDNKTATDKAIADEKERAMAAESAIETKIGTVTEGKNVVTMISEAQTAAENYAKEQAQAASGSAAGVQAALNEYKTANDAKVNANASAIETLNGTGEGSVAKDIADAINALSADNGAIKNVADALATHEQTASTTYATKTELSNGLALKEDASNKISDALAKGVSDDVKKAAYPSFYLVEELIDSAASDTNTALAALNGSLADLTTTVGNNKTAAENAIKAEETRAKAAESAIETKIGTVTEGKDVVTMISDAQTAAENYAKEQAQAAAGDASKVADDLADYIESNNAAVALKANQTSLDATNSRVTTLETTVGDATKGLVKAAVDNANAAKAAADAAAANAKLITANAQAIAAEEERAMAAEAANKKAIEDEVTRAKAAEKDNADAAAAAQATADQAKATANAAIPAPQPECSDKTAKCVLTSGANGYEWEVVTRSDENK